MTEKSPTTTLLEGSGESADTKPADDKTLDVKTDGEKKEEQWLPEPRFNLLGMKDFCKGTLMILKEHPLLFLMLVFVPIAIISYLTKWGDVPTFIFCMLAIIPLSKLLGSATEELALRLNQTIGGLLNATFGNAVELIISIAALFHNLLRVVQASLLGSLLANLLLVLGSSIILGGVNYEIQCFNGTASQAQSSVLILAVMGILMPAAFFLSNVGPVTLAEQEVLNLSRVAAITMLTVYILYLFFQLKTHSHFFDEDAEGEREKPKKYRWHFAKYKAKLMRRPYDAAAHEKKEAEEEDEEETPKLSIWGAVFMLAAVTVLVAVLSEFLVDSITGVTSQLGISETFVGIVILPIVGNAAEHVTALTVAAKNKMDLAIGVAVGSSIQIAMLVIPVLVLLAWIVGKGLTLYFLGFETVALFITVIIVNSVLQDGKSNWLEGVLLVSGYLIISAGFYFHKDT